MQNQKKPKYMEIFEDLSLKIYNGTYQIGDKILSEMEYANLYRVSRITSKKALDLAAEKGLIEKKAGLGSFVISTSPKPPNQLDSRTIALILPELSPYYGMEFTNQMHTIANREGFMLLTFHSENSKEIEKDILLKTETYGVQGYIIMPVHDESFNNEIFKIILSGKPLILIDRYLRDLSCPNVVSDNRNASIQGMDHLFELGHRYIGILTRKIDNTSALRDRERGVIDSLKKNQIPEENVSWLTDLSPEEAYIAETKAKINQYILKHPKITAFYTFEYYLYPILESVLAEKNRRIPQDISIISFDSPLSFENSFKQITCLKQDEKAIAEQAYAILRAKLEGNEAMISEDKIPVAFIEGTTTAVVPKE